MALVSACRVEVENLDRSSILEIDRPEYPVHTVDGGEWANDFMSAVDRGEAPDLATWFRMAIHTARDNEKVLAGYKFSDLQHVVARLQAKVESMS